MFRKLNIAIVVAQSKLKVLSFLSMYCLILLFGFGIVVGMKMIGMYDVAIRCV